MVDSMGRGPGSPRVFCASLSLKSNPASLWLWRNYNYAPDQKPKSVLLGCSTASLSMDRQTELRSSDACLVDTGMAEASVSVCAMPFVPPLPPLPFSRRWKLRTPNTVTEPSWPTTPRLWHSTRYFLLLLIGVLGFCGDSNHCVCTKDTFHVLVTMLQPL